mmetsp:Transcript_23752/g.40897  ORF Transcript_23752/g.40897 Transcript_23752/m.40897 type:complete len:317 (-) Transcript_23752:38-988(-)|eukprot:CAMPEP_0196661744 /NCGR_PEP_ID=MMETSP1086-20130531/45683_1 /TAXON_ID=77921 /ORGANISM="Cyanoptyche  gloeocystis , Strain SAG4.97" /LENGTH=316 /DNA_ID=CAMNT_0041996781 /DNA_START=64 /DNA_END=1014 /DNA_ORIENTATION=-
MLQFAHVISLCGSRPWSQCSLSNVRYAKRSLKHNIFFKASTCVVRHHRGFFRGSVFSRTKKAFNSRATSSCCIVAVIERRKAAESPEVDVSQPAWEDIDALLHDDSRCDTAGLPLPDEETAEKLAVKIIETAFLSSIACVLYIMAKIAPGPVDSLLYAMSAVPFAITWVREDPKRCFTMTFVTFFLVLLTSGLVNATRMVLSSGLLGVVLGYSLEHNLPPVVTVPLGVSVKMAGLWVQFQIIAFTLNYDVLRFIGQILSGVVKRIADTGTNVPAALLGPDGPVYLILIVFAAASFFQTMAAYATGRYLVQKLQEKS